MSVAAPGNVISAITLPKIKTGDVQLCFVSENQTPSENNTPSQNNTPRENNSPETPEHVVGVGPWEGPHPKGAHWDPELLAHGDRRNVLDQYRYWKHDAIVADLNSRRHPLHIAIENWQHDFNIGTVVRNANAFNAAAVHIVGRRRWNRRGAMVTDRYMTVMHHPTVEDFVTWARQENIPILGIDIFPDSVQLETYSLPERCVLVFGQEGPGLSEEMRTAAVDTLSIEQFGSTRSINAGVASGIAMHAWIRQHVFNQHP